MIHAARGPAELRDLRVSPFGINLGLRSMSGNRVSGSLVQIGPTGRLLGSTSGPATIAVAAPTAPSPLGSTPWPLSPNAQHPVGNTYGDDRTGS